MTSNAKNASGVGPWLTHDELDLLSKMEPSQVLAQTEAAIREATNADSESVRSTAHPTTALPTEQLQAKPAQAAQPSAPPPPPGDPSKWAIVYLPWNAGGGPSETLVQPTTSPSADPFPAPTFDDHGDDLVTEGTDLGNPLDALPTAESLASRALASVRATIESTAEVSPETDAPIAEALPPSQEPIEVAHEETTESATETSNVASSTGDQPSADTGLGLWGAPTNQEYPIFEAPTPMSEEESEPASEESAADEHLHFDPDVGEFLGAQTLSLPLGLGDTAKARIELWSNPGSRSPRFRASVVIDEVPVGGTDEIDHALDAVRNWMIDRLGGLQPVYRTKRV
ncbi:MAG: hypothetical protein AAF196_18915 [Planctomycetota bacterium]